MALPFFYTDAATGEKLIALNEETSRHIAQVLRMGVGEQLQLTNGKGSLFTATITDNNKKKCIAQVNNTSFIAANNRQITIAISLVKNTHRFEWFLEKATEIGIAHIIPLLCDRTEKQQFRHDRMKGIVISAMLQSQQAWLPILHEPIKYNSFLAGLPTGNQGFIAHCEISDKIQLSSYAVDNTKPSIMLIGPEGDFNPQEIEQAVQHEFMPVSLGDNRLRTETAGIVAATLLKLL